MYYLDEIANAPGTTIIDVRTPAEFQGDHINGAKNIPLNELPYMIDEIKKMPQPLIVYCHSGGRSSMAEAIIKQQGIEEVYNGGGLSDMKFILKK